MTTLQLYSSAEMCNKASPQNYLAHHGILGQKWGKRNGPPYPLGKSDHSTSEKKAGWEKSLDNGNSASYNKSKSASSVNAKGVQGSSEKDCENEQTQKKKHNLVKIGLEVAATALVAYGAYKLADSGELHRLTEKGKAFLNGTEPIWNKNPGLANKDWSAEEIYKNVVRRINPDYGKLGATRNCRRCTFAYELARRGFDVEATKTIGGTGQSEYGLYNTTHDKPVEEGLISVVTRFLVDEEFRDTLITSHDNGTYLLGEKVDIIGDSLEEHSKSIFDALVNYPDGARGELAIERSVGGHSMAWEIVKGKPVIFDCQTGDMFDTAESFMDRAIDVQSAATTRLDNAELNYDFLQRWVKNSKGE